MHFKAGKWWGRTVVITMLIIFTVLMNARNITTKPGFTNVSLMWLPPIQPEENVFYTYRVHITATGALVTSGMTTQQNVTISHLNEFTNYTVTVLTTENSTLFCRPVAINFVTSQRGMLYSLLVTVALFFIFIL